MGSGVFDSIILKHLWGTDEIYEVFSDEGKIKGWLDFEAALALSQADMGIIPAEAGAEIARHCKPDEVDLAEVSATIREIKHRLMPVLKAVQSKCVNDAGEWIHFGATSQDAVDTGTMLQVKRAHAIFLRDLKVIGQELYRLTEMHRDSPMAGRTHGVHALPITFGHKTAIWLREISRDHARLTACAETTLVGSLVGAVGTMAALGPDAVELERRVMDRLGLGQAEISWAPARDRVAAYASVLGLIGGALAKIANEIFVLQRDEIGELEEPFTEGKIGSSTMPHKRNPTVLENVLASSRALRYNVSMIAEAMVQENERDGVPWKTEWKALPECCMLLAGMLSQMKFVLKGLVVHTDRMRTNLDLLGGLLVSERVMFALSEQFGKQSAHKMVYNAAIGANAAGITFREALNRDPKIGAALNQEQLDELLDAGTYVGLAPELVDRALLVTRQEGWLD